MKASRPRVAVHLALGQARALRREGELVFQEREVLGDLHPALEIAVEGAGLQGGEESVQFGHVHALTGLLLLDGLNDGGEAVLEFGWWNRDRETAKNLQVDVFLGNLWRPSLQNVLEEPK